MAYPWFRLWNSILQDPKVQMLTPVRFKQWINLLAVANEGKPRGVLPASHQVIAFHLRCDEAEVPGILEEFKAAELVDETPDGFSPHNWRKWQPASDGPSTGRVKKCRESKAAETTMKRFTPVSGNVSGNGRETEVQRFPSNSVSSYVEENSLNTRNTETEEKRFTPVSGNVSETFQRTAKPCPEYPDPETSFNVIHPGPHEIPAEQARTIWRRLWATWGEEKILYGWYEHQRWYSVEAWLAACAAVKKQYGDRAVGIRLIEKFAADIDAHGVKAETPFAPEDRGTPATTSGGRPKTDKQVWREEVSAHRESLKAKRLARWAQGDVEEWEKEEYEAWVKLGTPTSSKS